MKQPRIELDRVGKQFTLRHNASMTLKDGMIRLLSRKRPAQEEETFWALKDISFDVFEGEVVGLLGSNGAGKSTLLRLVSKTMSPTTGRLLVRGRVTPLLSLGLGFHNELTGRENIYHNTAFYGLTRADTDAICNEIIAFSELERFIETPLKGYSSGMRMRLGFSIAVHLDPDIMVIDEVLSTGDRSFQEKSQAKMLDLIQSGKTVLLTSHNLAFIEEVCNRAYLLKGGTIEAQGDPASVIEAYKGQKAKELSLSLGVPAPPR